VRPDGPELAAGQVMTVFRSRLRPDAAGYGEEAARMAALVGRAAGLIEFKTFVADDGERVTVVTFVDWASHEAWRRQADHLRAQARGRREFYAEFSLQVGVVQRCRRFVAGASS
jgi:heme-degrading monooxygenase HmoA